MTNIERRIKAISFRQSLSGEISDFLSDENLADHALAEALLELVVALSHYREEGVSISLEVYLFKDLDRALQVIQGSEALHLGRGPCNKHTVRQALKRCALLAQGGWSV